MTHSLHLFTAGLLMAITAAGYAFATIGMQVYSHSDDKLPTLIIITGLSVAAIAEITLLRQASLPVVYLGIMVTETILVLGYAAWAHHGLILSQISGGTLVVAGFALVCSQG
ncbi:5-aminolevulinate synthase [Sulfitobacter sp. MF3-043]|uniref:5-aminolevulinate synthase n=1 Tax=Sulfitobacter sediminivivens TaxID=3252902 RepID=UPI0036DD2C79